MERRRARSRLTELSRDDGMNADEVGMAATAYHRSHFEDLLVDNKRHDDELRLMMTSAVDLWERHGCGVTADMT